MAKVAHGHLRPLFGVIALAWVIAHCNKKEQTDTRLNIDFER